VQFTLENIDMDCSLTNPLFAAAMMASAFLLGAWMAWTVRQRWRLPAKGLHLAAALAVSLTITSVVPALLTAWFEAEETGPGRVIEYGCMVSSPTLVGPFAAAVCAVLLYATTGIWRRGRARRVT
jgi:hypothetical protein